MPWFRIPFAFAYRRVRLAPLTVGAMLALVLVDGVAAQTPQAQAQDQAPSAPASEPAPAKPTSPGLLEEIGKILTAPSALLPSLKPADPTPKPAPETAPAPAPPIVAPPPAAAETPASDPPGSRILPGIVSGRELCPRSENGAPDCKAGSDKLCRGKGYTTGKSLDTDAAFACSTKPLHHRGKLCGTDTYVIRAFCQ